MYPTVRSKCTVPKIKIIAHKVQYFSFSAKQWLHITMVKHTNSLFYQIKFSIILATEYIKLYNLLQLLLTLWSYFCVWSSELLHWSNSARRHWTISLPGMWWGCIVSLDMLEYEVMRVPMSSQGTALFYSLSDLSRPWESLGRIYKEGLDICWLTSTGYGGKVLVTPKDRLEN
jgi:hypothetical protein